MTIGKHTTTPRYLACFRSTNKGVSVAITMVVTQNSTGGWADFDGSRNIYQTRDDHLLYLPGYQEIIGDETKQTCAVFCFPT